MKTQIKGKLVIAASGCGLPAQELSVGEVLAPPVCLSVCQSSTYLTTYVSWFTSSPHYSLFVPFHPH